MASHNSFNLPYDLRRSQSHNSQSAHFQSMNHNTHFPDNGGQSWAYSQSPTSPISPVSPTSIGTHKNYTLAGALNPRPKSRQHPSSANVAPASSSSSSSVTWSSGQQRHSAFQHASAASAAHGSADINTGNFRPTVPFKQPSVPLLSQPQPPSRVSMNTMRSPSDIIEEEDLEGYEVEDFVPSNQYDEPSTTSNANYSTPSHTHPNDGQLNMYQPVPSPVPELQYPAGVSGTPTDFLLGFAPSASRAGQTSYEVWQEGLQIQMLQQHPDVLAASQQLPAHMQQQQFRYSAQSMGDGSGDPFIPSPPSRTGSVQHYPGVSETASSAALASPTTVSSGRSVPAQNIFPGLQKGKGKEREHAAIPALPGVPAADFGHGGSKVANKSQQKPDSSSSSPTSAKTHHFSVQGGAKPNASAANAKEPQYKTVKVDHPSSAPGEPPKKVKMHQCPVCEKLFPRPSGLETHMNSHSGAKPFKCPLELCNKTFAVRSNARRHLKTHGISLPGDADGKDDTAKEEYQVGFEEPVVIDVHEFGFGFGTNDGDNGAGTGAGGTGSSRGRPRQRRVELRWVPPSLTGRTNAGRLRSLSPASDMADVDVHGNDDDEEEDDDDDDVATASKSNPRRPSGVDLAFSSQRRRPGLHVAPTPLPPVRPTDAAACADVDVKYEERNSYAETGAYPYHPQQHRSSRH